MVMLSSPQTDILKSLRMVIDLEAQALVTLSDSLGSEAVAAVNFLLESSLKGHKIVVTGMGKSGFVARKIAATMSSTGTLAVFLHPAEAMHGDLGIVQKGDVVLAIGRSGESEELNLLLPSLKRIGAKIVAMTSKVHSTLAQASDFCIPTGEFKEAGPFDLAPTTSAVVATAMGDALAMTLMKLKNFQPADYALFHPGGQLGRRLTMKILDVMVPVSKCPYMNPATASLENVIGSIGTFGLGVVLFGSEDYRLEGLLTDGDLRRALSQHKEKIFSMNVSELINRSPFTVDAQEMAMDVLAFMEQRERPLNLVPVVDGNQVVGVVRTHDLLKL